MTLEEERARGKQAELIINSPIWKEAWDEIERSITQKWRNEPNIGTEGREALWSALRLSEKARKHVERVLSTGKAASEQLGDLIDG